MITEIRASTATARRGAVTLFLTVLLSLPHPCLGQSLHGRVLVAGDTTGIDGVALTLVDSTGLTAAQSQTDSLGWFRVGLDHPGTYRLQAARLGFATTSANLLVQEGEIVELELRMDTEAIQLDPLVVIGRRRIKEGTLDEFYDRMARMRQKGRGYFIEREEIENRGGASTTLLLARVPGVFLQPSGASGYAIQMRRPGSYCSPDIYVDGLEQPSYRIPDLSDLEGVEVYRGRFEPVEGYWPSDCGMIFFWRKSGWGNPITLKRAILFGALLAAVLLF